MRVIKGLFYKGIFFIILIWSSLILQTNKAEGQTVLNNNLLRFGTGAENSVNITGNLQQPFYFNSTLALWRKLTFSSYPLDNTFAIGGDGSSEWNLNGTLVENPPILGQVIDLSGYVVTTAPNGYGTIISDGTVIIGGSSMGVQHKYELGQNNAYIKVTTKITNSSGSPVNNVRFWIGTRDDYVGGTDQPLKEKGNLVNGAFVMLSNPTDRGLALRISTTTEGVLFYTNSTKGNNIINSCCAWTNVTNQNPQTSTITITNDGSYGFYVRMNDLAVGQSDEFTWYYAAGELDDLEDIISEVAAASGAISDLTCNTATFRAQTSVNGMGYWMVVPDNSPTPTATEIKAGVNYGTVNIIQSGSGAMLANVDAFFYLSGLTGGTNYDLYFVSEDYGTPPAFSSVATVPFTTTGYGTPTITCPADITVNNAPNVCGAVVNFVAPIGADNCGGGTTTVQTAGLPSGSLFPKGTTTNTFEVTGGGGLTASCSFTVTVVDNEAPVITCPPTITMNNDPGNCSAVVTFVDPIGTDNCPGAFTFQTAGLPSGSTFPVGTTTITFVVADEADLTNTCSFNVVVVDNEPPVIVSCPYPTGIVKTVNPGSCVATINMPDTPIATDNCGVATIINDFNGTSDASDDYPVGPTVITWTITDIHGNTSTCETHVLVSDNILPTVITQNITVYLNAQGVAAITPAQINNGSTDNCSIVNMTLSETVFSCTDLGANTVTLVVTDVDNNQSSATAIVTVLDNSFPSITSPANLIATTNNGCTATGLNIGTPIYSDNCAVVITNDAPAAFPLGSTTVTWTATDASGNATTSTQTVTITDNINPTITCPANVITVTNTACTATGVALGTPVTADNCGVATVSNDAPLAFPLGTTIVTWTVVDNAGNTATCEQLVTVNDNVVPTIVCPPTKIAYTNTGCTATGVDLGMPVTNDNCSVASVSNNAPGAFPLGNTNVIWTVTDGSGNTATCTQIVTVIDNVSPIVHCAPAIVIPTNTGCTATGVVLDIPLVMENCNVASLTNNAPAVFSLGNTTVIWTAVDGSGNTGTCSQLVIVVDATPPTITCPANVITVTNTACTATGVALGTPVTADNCGVATVSNDAPLAFPLGTTIVTWTVVDNAGNTATCEQLVTVNDNVMPTIVCPPTKIAYTNTGCTATGVDLGMPVTNDNCNVASVTNNAPGAFPLGNTNVIWTVTDGSGNTATCTQIVTVIDNVSPVVHCAPAIVIPTNTGCTATGVVLDIPLVTENCNLASLTNNGLTVYPLGNTTVTWTAVDGSGNSGTCTQVITVIDNVNPTITCPANVVTPANNGCSAINVALGTPVTADNCGVASVTNNAPTTFPLGITTVTWIVTDNAGNTQSCAQLVTVIDTIFPVINCPVSVSVNTEPGACDVADILIGYPIFTDNCSVGMGITNNAPAIYPVGLTNVTWIVTDGSGNASSCVQTVTVGCSPLAVDDSVSTYENTPLIIDVLANDIDCGNNIDPGAVTIVTVPVNGTVVVNSDGTITYTPDYLFVGQNQFIYQVCDSLNLCDFATVYITVLPVNNPVLGIAKAVSIVEPQEDGSFNVTYVITAENFGNDLISQIQITDNLTETFPLPAVFKVLSVPLTNSTLTPNSSFNGSTNINLLDSSASFLNIGAIATVEFIVNVAIYGNEEQSFFNYAVGTGVGTLGTFVTDVSTNGYIADANVNTSPADDSLVTPLTLKPEDIFIPDGFSPNGDNINDLFVINGIGDFPDSKLTVFNRWGNIVYTTTGYKNDWDGKPNTGALILGDKPLPQGTYFYILEYNKDDRPARSSYLIISY